MKKLIFGSIAITVVVLIVVVFYNYVKKLKEAAAQKADPANFNSIPDMPVGGGNTLASNGSVWPIQYKKFNENAKPLQLALGVDADGIIGPITLKEWQKYNPEVNISTTIPNQAALNSYLQNIAEKRKKQTAITPPLVFNLPRPWLTGAE